MWITRQTDYATRAVLALAMAGDRAPLKLRDLADRTSVPSAFLEQIMPQLRLAGVVRSERGPSGGTASIMIRPISLWNTSFGSSKAS